MHRKGSKKLLLANFTEIYALFKSKNLKFIIWSLDFRSSLPKMAQTCRCIRLPQCLCMHYHQNVRLMIHAENPLLDYKNILKLCVCCDITNHSCMLHHFDFALMNVLVENSLWDNCGTIIIPLVTQLRINGGSVEIGVSYKIMRKTFMISLQIFCLCYLN